MGYIRNRQYRSFCRLYRGLAGEISHTRHTLFGNGYRKKQASLPPPSLMPYNIISYSLLTEFEGFSLL